MELMTFNEAFMLIKTLKILTTKLWHARERGISHLNKSGMAPIVIRKGDEVYRQLNKYAHTLNEQAKKYVAIHKYTGGHWRGRFSQEINNRAVEVIPATFMGKNSYILLKTYDDGDFDLQEVDHV